jgi:hypothetical protein
MALLHVVERRGVGETEVEDDYDLWVPHFSDGRREKGEWMEEREGQLGHFTCFADLDPS